MPVMEVSVVPVGTKTSSVSKYVADALKVLRKEKSIKYQLTAMGTIVEADSVDKLLDIVKKMHQSVLDRGVQRVVTSIKIDDRLDKKITIESKIKSIEEKL